MKKRIIFTLLTFIPIILFGGIRDDAVYKELKRVFTEDARTQLELNLASGAMAKYANEQLLKLESKIESELYEDMIPYFQESCKKWREFRHSVVILHGKLYEGGTMQPMVHNHAYANCTTRRIEELEEYDRYKGGEG